MKLKNSDHNEINESLTTASDSVTSTDRSTAGGSKFGFSDVEIKQISPIRATLDMCAWCFVFLSYQLNRLDLINFNIPSISNCPSKAPLPPPSIRPYIEANVEVPLFVTWEICNSK